MEPLLVNAIFCVLITLIAWSKIGLDASVAIPLTIIAIYTVVEVYIGKIPLAIETKLMLWSLNLLWCVVTLVTLYLFAMGWSDVWLLAAMAITGASGLLSLVMVNPADELDETEL